MIHEIKLTPCLPNKSYCLYEVHETEKSKIQTPILQKYNEEEIFEYLDEKYGKYSVCRHNNFILIGIIGQKLDFVIHVM